MLTKRLLERFFALSVASVLGSVAAHAEAQSAQPRAVSLSAEDARTFSGVLKAISSQAHVAFVAEDKPLQTEISREAASDITGAVSLDQQIYKVARAFDYTVVKKGNVYGFLKRYTDPRDLPSLTYDEVKLSAVREQAIVKQFWTYEDWLAHWKLGSDFVRELSPDDKQKIVAHSLKVSSLNAGMKTSYLNLEMFQTLNHPAYILNQATSWLNQDPEKVVFLWEYARDFKAHVAHYDSSTTSPSKRYFGFHVSPEIKQDPAFFVPLSGEYVQTSGFIGGTVQAGTPDGADDLTAPENDVVASNSASLTSLDKAVATLNTKTGKKPLFSVEPGLKSKRITLIGGENASALPIAQIVANIYGLKLDSALAGRQMTYRLTYPVFTVPTEYADAQKAFQSALPKPLWRALHIDALRVTHFEDPSVPEDADLGKEETLEQLRAAMEQERLQKQPDRSPEIMMLYNKLHASAVAHLRKVIEPQLARMPEGKTTLASLDDEAKSAYAITVFTSVIGEIARTTLYQTTEPFKYLQYMVVGGEVHEVEPGRVQTVSRDSKGGMINKPIGGGTEMALGFYLMDQTGGAVFNAPLGRFFVDDKNHILETLISISKSPASK